MHWLQKHQVAMQTAVSTTWQCTKQLTGTFSGHFLK